MLLAVQGSEVWVSRQCLRTGDSSGGCDWATGHVERGARELGVDEFAKVPVCQVRPQVLHHTGWG